MEADNVQDAITEMDQDINQLNQSLKNKVNVIQASHNLNSGEPITITFSGATRFKINVFGTAIRSALFMGYTTSDSTPYIVDIYKSDAINITTTSGSITISSTNSNNSYVFVEVLYGINNIQIS